MELNINGSANKLSVSDAVFGREFSEDLVHQVVVAYRNAGRAGTKAQKTRSEVNGTTKKSKKQKGGGARHGALTAPIFVGGGVTFAAKPRSFAQKVNRKMYRAGIASILSQLVREERLKVIESIAADTPKTGQFAKKMKGLGLEGTVLVVTDRLDENVFLASRNLPNVLVLEAREHAEARGRVPYARLGTVLSGRSRREPGQAAAVAAGMEAQARRHRADALVDEGVADFAARDEPALLAQAAVVGARHPPLHPRRPS